MRAQKATNSFTRLRQCITYLTPGITSFWRKLSVTSDCQGRSSEVDLQNFSEPRPRGSGPGYVSLKHIRSCHLRRTAQAHPDDGPNPACTPSRLLFPFPPFPAFPPDNRPRPGPASKDLQGGARGIPGGGLPTDARSSASGRRRSPDAWEVGSRQGRPSHTHPPTRPQTQSDTIPPWLDLARGGWDMMGWDEG